MINYLQYFTMYSMIKLNFKKQLPKESRQKGYTFLDSYFLSWKSCLNFTLPEVTEGDEIHDSMASFMKISAQTSNRIATTARKIGMTFIILNLG